MLRIGLSRRLPLRKAGKAVDTGIGCHGAELIVGLLADSGDGANQLLFVI